MDPVFTVWLTIIVLAKNKIDIKSKYIMIET